MDAIRSEVCFPYRWIGEKGGVLACGCDRGSEPMPLVMQCLRRIWKADIVEGMRAVSSLQNRQIAAFFMDWWWAEHTKIRFAIQTGNQQWREGDVYLLDVGVLAHERTCRDHDSKRQRI